MLWDTNGTVKRLKLSDEVQGGCGEDKLSWWLSPSESWLFVFGVGKESVRKVSNSVVEKNWQPAITTNPACSRKLSWWKSLHVMGFNGKK